MTEETKQEPSTEGEASAMSELLAAVVNVTTEMKKQIDELKELGDDWEADLLNVYYQQLTKAMSMEVSGIDVSAERISIDVDPFKGS